MSNLIWCVVSVVIWLVIFVVGSWIVMRDSKIELDKEIIDAETRK